MPIPDFQAVMLPLLKLLSDNQEHSMRDALNELSSYFLLTDEQRNQMLPSRNQTIFYNRVTWAKAHLKMASLVENTKRGYFKISENGINLLEQNQTQINLKTLKQIPGYLENSGRVKEENKSLDTIEEAETKETPEESIEYNYLKVRKNLALEIITKVKSCSPAFFENLVVELLVKMGYGGTIKEAGNATRLTNDGGIDGIIKEDKLGLDFIYIQAKRWDNQAVGRPDIQSFVGALDGQRANKGVFITTSRFADTAIEYVRTITKKVILIDGIQLANYMLDYGLGVSTLTTYEIKKIDNDYFEEE